LKSLGKLEWERKKKEGVEMGKKNGEKEGLL